MTINPIYQKGIEFDVLDAHLGSNIAAANALRDMDLGDTNPLTLDAGEYAKLSPASQQKVDAARPVLQSSATYADLVAQNPANANYPDRVGALKDAYAGDTQFHAELDAVNHIYPTKAGVLRPHQMDRVPAEHRPAIEEAYAKADVEVEESRRNVAVGAWAVTLSGAAGLGLAGAALFSSGPIGGLLAAGYVIASVATTIREGYHIADNLPGKLDSDQPRWARALIKIGSVIRNGVFGA